MITLSTRWPPFGSLLQRQIIYLSIKMAKSYMFGGVFMYWDLDANDIFFNFKVVITLLIDIFIVLNKNNIQDGRHFAHFAKTKSSTHQIWRCR